MIDFGTVRPGTTLYVPFATYDSNDPTASVTMTGLAVTDIEIYKDGGTTQRGSDAGYTLLDTDGIDFDGVTGIHGFSIDLADNTTAGFYSAGSQYWIVVSSITVDAGTINFIAGTFRIGIPDAVLNTTIDTLASQTSFTLTAGPAEDDALNGCVVYIHDVASAVQGGWAVVSDYTGSSKTVTLTAGTTYTVAATDNVAIFSPVNPKWFGATAVTGRDIGASVLLSTGTGTGQLDFTSGVVKSNVTQYNGAAGTFASGRPEVNTSHIAGGAVSTSSAQIGVNVVNAGGTAWGSGAITSGAFATGAITATAIAADAIGASELAADAATEIGTAVWATATRTLTANTNLNDPTAAAIADAVWDEARSGHTSAGSFGQGVASVQGNVTGSTASIAAAGITSTSFDTGAITATAIASDAIGASELATDAVTEIANAVAALTIEGSLTLQNALKLVLAAAAGKVSGADGTTITIRDTTDTYNRIVATVDQYGNRSAVSYVTT